MLHVCMQELAPSCENPDQYKETLKHMCLTLSTCLGSTDTMILIDMLKFRLHVQASYQISLNFYKME